MTKNEELQKLALEKARNLLANLIHYRSGCSYYETDVTRAMLELIAIAEWFKEKKVE